MIERAVQPLTPLHDALPQAENGSLAGDIVRELEERGVPEGAWLVDVVRVRQALRDADTLLRRLEEAIVRAAGAPRDAY